MVHHRQRLAFRLKAGDHLPGVHPEFYDFEGYFAADGIFLLGQIDFTHSTFTQEIQDFIGANVIRENPIGQGA